MSGASARPRLVDRVGDEPVIAVDGAFGAARGLELSHWPGNRTPRDLAHDLSTGCALAFARLAPAERERRAGGATRVVNNHYDTDGALALWTALHPDRALRHERALLDAAAAGDFYAVPTREAFVLDALVSLMVDPERSPLRGALAGLDDAARRERALDEVFAHVEGWLSQPLDGPAWAPYRAALAPVLARLDRDLADLAAAERTDDAERDLAHFVARVPIAPGRHALFHAAARDRVLVSAPAAGGWTHRLVVGTRSWFDLVSAPPPARFDLAAVVRALAAGEAERDGFAWRAEDGSSPSPELWFGAAGLGRFAEHNDALAASRTPPDAVLAAVRAAPRLG